MISLTKDLHIVVFHIPLFAEFRASVLLDPQIQHISATGVSPSWLEKIPSNVIRTSQEW